MKIILICICAAMGVFRNVISLVNYETDYLLEVILWFVAAWFFILWTIFEEFDILAMLKKKLNKLLGV